MSERGYRLERPPVGPTIAVPLCVLQSNRPGLSVFGGVSLGQASSLHPVAVESVRAALTRSVWGVPANAFHQSGPGCPRLSSEGGMAVPCLGRGRGGFPCPITPLCKRIGIAIPSLHQGTVGRIDPFDLPLVRLDIKGAGFAHLHASYMDAPGLELVRDDGPHPVAGLETLDLLLAQAVSAREARFAPIRATMLPPPGGRDRDGLQPALSNACEISDAERVEGMRLRDAKAGAIPARAPACPGADR